MVNVLVVGDLMIDHYVWGSCDRISPEAPVQVVNIKNETKRLGGLGNVVSNLKTLGSEVGIISVVGDDDVGDEILELLKDRGAKTELIIKEKGRKSSQKSRIMVAHQQVLRLDTESVCEIGVSDDIISEFENILSGYDIVLLSDYGKGVLSPYLTKEIIRITKKSGKMVLIDPKGKDYSKYSGATLLTPNKKEASEALGFGINDEDDLKHALKMLKDKFKLDYSLITLSEDGIALLDEDVKKFPALAKEVFDVTGAGDSVLATLGYCLASKMSLEESIEIANLAAAVVVGKVGSADASWGEIENLKSKKSGFERKIISLDELLRVDRSGKTMVFTNGCFDILHFGHISYLQSAKKLGDMLVVGLNSDRSVKELKGDNRPVNAQSDRSSMLAALEFVDFVVIFDEDTPLNLIKTLKPDILVKGADYTGKKVVGSEFVREVKLIDFIDGKSTTNIINKIKG
ncbi:D-glycero-beta-D-manno-heptose-7-phosphate kinase [Campylobacter fetus]|uniref:D-glycero-beta-D-manno-heptose-7-phosphate kinase n=1 Tax=Campylobacter fetus TaxID=196 RepID=UPI000FCA543D|nr:D-glycero-beta-D-manno-heptose-7-phosphate kinase [Campylobacter fetus]RUT50527.1 bifunctional heptose 7-phosphate kinase/heptose 1-phosphate adenyltransferase [Campylobacter fetus]RUT50844.1 bifunctional heptose 7-phosphate kinase/heptose 1-phosphate adenyltransferase [Campylobacter fetus]